MAILLNISPPLGDIDSVFSAFQIYCNVAIMRSEDSDLFHR